MGSVSPLKKRVLARSGNEDSATANIQATLREATSLPTLVARYQHAWQQAARDSLRMAAEAVLSPAAVARLIAERGSGELAAVLASAAGRNADPTHVLRAALILDELKNVRSPALVLASRIEDHADTLGVPREPPMGQPLPWLQTPDVGHASWNVYLRNRAELITARARELGSLTECYREQYHLGHLRHGDLGEMPLPGTARRAAFDAAANDSDFRTRALASPWHSQARRAASSARRVRRLESEHSPGLRY